MIGSMRKRFSHGLLCECRMAQATAPILDSTEAAERGCPQSGRVLEGKRTLDCLFGRAVRPAPALAIDAEIESIEVMTAP